MKKFLMKANFFDLKTLGYKVFAVCFLLLRLLVPVTKAQEANEKKMPIPFPVVPIIAEYEYEPHYFMQWIKNHAEFSMIEAVLGDKLSAEDARIILTEKSTGKRVFYCQSEARAKSLQAAGREAYVAKIDFKQTPGASDQPTYGFGFRDKNNQPILWRVTTATRPSERGAGLTGQSATDGNLRLQYRDLGTAVGEGTAVQIGDKVIEAEPWTEISAPPYFVAFRGAVTDGNHAGAFLIKSEKWTVTVAPSELKTGAEWNLKDESGRRRTFKIAAQNKDELTIDETNQNETAPLRLIVRATPLGFALRLVELESLGKKMRIAFTPELPALDASFSGKTEVAFTVAEGKNQKIAGGTVIIERQAGNFLLRWQPRTPDWAKSKAFDTLIALGANGYSIETTAGKK